MFDKKKKCDMLSSGWWFHKNSTLQLFYHGDIVNAITGHYEPITFYNA
jgi:hypothetical protein